MNKEKAERTRIQIKLYSTVPPPEELQLKYAIAKSNFDEATADFKFVYAQLEAQLAKE